MVVIYVESDMSKLVVLFSYCQERDENILFEIYAPKLLASFFRDRENRKMCSASWPIFSSIPLESWRLGYTDTQVYWVAHSQIWFHSKKL